MRTKIFNTVKFSNATSPLCTIKSTCLITIDNLENIVSCLHDLVASGMLNVIYFECLICSSNSVVTCFLNIFLLKDHSRINITYNILCSLIYQRLLGPLGFLTCFGYKQSLQKPMHHQPSTFKAFWYKQC